MDNKRFARTYFEGLEAKDMSGLRYAEDAILWAPLGPEAGGWDPPGPPRAGR